MAINSKILNNTVSNTSGARPAYIALDVEAFAPDNYRGIGMMDIQVGGNTVNPYPANPNLSYNPAENEISQEGFLPCFLFGPAPVKDPVTTVFRNINLWNDTQNVVVTYTPSFLPYASQACVTASAPLVP